MGGAKPLAIDILAVVDQGTLACDRMHDEQARDVGVSELAPKDMDANAAELRIDIAGNFPV
ncbi:hypothetical protein D3C87_2160370 [compost metagenome]